MTDNYGASHTVFGSSGAPLTSIGGTLEECSACKRAEDDFEYFQIYQETGGAVTLICPRCSETKTVWANEVKRKPTS